MSPTRRVLAAVLAPSLVLTMVAISPSEARTAAPTDWRQYVLTPATANPEPVRVAYVAGVVTNADALAPGGSGVTTLTTSSTGKPATLVLDYGVDIAGTPQITIDTVSGGPATIAQGASETRKFVLDANGKAATDAGQVKTDVVAAPGAVRGLMHGGFRFHVVQLTSVGSVTISDTNTEFAAYRATPDKFQGHFLSSSDQLNKYWYSGAYTAHLNMVPAGTPPATGSMLPIPTPVDQVFDGAKRDRLLWSGDLVVQNPAILLSLGSNGSHYMANSLNAMLRSQEPSGRLPSAGIAPGGGGPYATTYSAYTAIAAIDYYRRTGESEFINEHLPRLERAEEYHRTLLNANGLIVSNDPDYWQTPQQGEVTEYSLVYLQLLQELEWLEKDLNRDDKAASYRRAAKALAKAINRNLWDDEVGAYVRSDQDRGTYPLDANANAVRFGVAVGSRATRVLRFLEGGWTPYGAELSQGGAGSLADPYGHTIEPLPNGWEVEARLKAGDAPGALDLMDRMWGQMVDTSNPMYTGAFWEFLYPDGQPRSAFDSLAHGWAAAPTALLTEYVLGVRPEAAGYREFSVEPYTGAAPWAEGAVPTPRGPIEVEWSTARAGVTVTVETPASTTGLVTLPPGKYRGTDGKVYHGSRTVAVRPGRFTFAPSK